MPASGFAARFRNRQGWRKKSRTGSMRAGQDGNRRDLHSGLSTFGSECRSLMEPFQTIRMDPFQTILALAHLKLAALATHARAALGDDLVATSRRHACTWLPACRACQLRGRRRQAAHVFFSSNSSLHICCSCTLPFRLGPTGGIDSVIAVAGVHKVKPCS